MKRALRTAALLLLLAPGPFPAPARAEKCLDCHDKKAIGKGERSVHPPFGEEDCTACHADHGDSEKLVLARSGNALCTECHDTGDTGLLKAHRGIRGDRASCLSCHDPHRSAQERLLRPSRHRPLAFGRCDPCHRYDGRLLKPTVKELCLGCHAGEEFSRRVAHGPVRSGECLACHDPHGSREPFLLKGRYAAGRWTTGEADMALCFGCHDRTVFTSGVPVGTGFRSPGRNYHALHVTGDAAPARPGAASQRLSCRNCHETHTSDWPRLVRHELDCGGVPCLRLDYRRIEGGGECLSGCHGPQAYAAEGPGAAPVPAGAPATAPARTMPEPSALERSINRRCVSCHEKAVRRFAKKHIHAPVRAGYCSACHLDHGPENRLILLGEEDRVCGKCHDLRDVAAVAAHKGFPLAGSRCSECHDPHAEDGAALLLPRRHAPYEEGDCAACHGAPAAGWRIPGRVSEACLQCHDEVGRDAHPHPAIARQGCTGCHSPHLSREPKLLRAARPALCFRCHPRQRFAQETVHPPVAEGDCAACHPAHGSANPRLLARPYPLEQFVPFGAEKYALCWDCHDEGSITDPARVGDTQFSDGKRNLHALHLRDRTRSSGAGDRVQPGVSCRNCHDPHATEGPRLIRRVLDCNGVPCLKIDYRKIGAGGKCLGGCHDMQSYSR
jgi:predicted CXXCH cytochrome family protein